MYPMAKKTAFALLKLDSVSVTDKHNQLFGSLDSNTSIAPSADTTFSKKGVFSEFLKAKTDRKDTVDSSTKYVAVPEAKDRVSLHSSQFRRPNPQSTKAIQIQSAIEEIKDNEDDDEFPKINYRKALEPKVSLPFRNQPDKIPRKIELERKKRLYSSLDIESLIEIELNSLKLKGLLHPDAGHPPKFKEEFSDVVQEIERNEVYAEYSEPDYAAELPLEAFDDTEFDSRTVGDWLDMGSIPDDEEEAKSKSMQKKKLYALPEYPNVVFAGIPLPAKAFDGKKWRNCKVIAYNKLENNWKVQWRNYNGWELDQQEESNVKFVHHEDRTLINDIRNSSNDPIAIQKSKEAWLPRINIMFLAEDPANFSKRVANAFLRRYQVAQKLKYNFYLDCMPIPKPAVEWSEVNMPKIFEKYAESFEKSKHKASLIDNLKAEFDLEYGRTHNKFLFDLENSIDSTEKHLNSLSSKVLEKNYILSDYRIDESKKNFVTKTFLTSPEILKLLSVVRHECNKLLDRGIFVDLQEAVKLDDFSQIQKHSVEDAKEYLKSSWISVLRDFIQAELKEVRSGWYNIKESNIEVYKMGKLSKFFNTVNFIMQDSMRSFALSSLQKFASQICNYPSNDIVINGPKSVKLNGKILFSEAEKELFKVEVIFADGKLQYDTDLQAFETALIGLVEEALGATANLPMLETLVMEKIFFADKPLLQRLFTNESEILNIRADITQNLRQSVAKIEEYLTHFDKYLTVMNIDVSQFAEEYEMRDKTLEEMDNDIRHYDQEWERFEEEIPTQITIGLFKVNCENVRSGLKRNFGNAILKLMAKKAWTLVGQVSECFSEIENRLEEKPRDMEDVLALREFMKSVPDAIEEATPVLIEIQNHFDMLDSHRYEYSSEVFEGKWKALSWPGKIEEILAEVENYLQDEEQSISKAATIDQEDSSSMRSNKFLP